MIVDVVRGIGYKKCHDLCMGRPATSGDIDLSTDEHLLLSTDECISLFRQVFLYWICASSSFPNYGKFLDVIRLTCKFLTYIPTVSSPCTYIMFIMLGIQA